MTTRARGWSRAAAWSTAVVSCALTVTGIYLQARHSDIAWLGETSVLTGLTPFVSVLVGTVIVDRKGNHPVGWLFCLSGLLWGLDHIGVAYASAATRGIALGGPEALTWLVSWAAFAAFGLAPVLVVYLFPSGRLAGRTWRWLFAFGVVGLLPGTLGFAFTPGSLENYPGVENPYGASGWVGEVAAALTALAWPLLGIATIGGVLSLRRRTRTASFAERQQVKWMVFAGAAMVSYLAFFGVMDALGHAAIAEAGIALFLPAIPLAAGTAILAVTLQPRVAGVWLKPAGTVG